MEIKSGLQIERTLKPYLIGLALAVLLTAVPFGLVATGALPRESTLIASSPAAKGVFFRNSMIASRPS